MKNTEAETLWNQEAVRMAMPQTLASESPQSERVPELRRETA